MPKSSTNLNRNKKIVLFGINTIATLIENCPELIYEIHILENSKNRRIEDLINLTDKIGLNYKFQDKETLLKISKNNKNQGIVAISKFPSFKNFHNLKSEIETFDKNSSILILDSIKDPQNLGACIRTAYAAGTDALILNQDNSASINEFVFKTSVGAIFKMRIYVVPNIINVINLLKDNNYWIYGMDAESKISIYDTIFSKKVAVIMGSEEKGMKQITQKNCDEIVTIPMKTNFDSLNVSVASGIVLFEINRQKHKE